MDNSSDDKISFDTNGFCNYCTSALEYKKQVYFPNEEGKQKLVALIDKLKTESKDKEYDCLMGVSGGLDSSYLLYLGYKWGLRILALHLDDGFDTDTSKKNIKKLFDATKLDLINIRPDSEQFNALTKAYMKAGVPNLAVPQDNIIFAEIYKYAKKNGISCFLSGSNFSLESILQKGNTHAAFDLTNIKDIHEKNGEKPIDKLTLLSDFQRIKNSKLLKIKTLRPLNYIDYNRDRALKELSVFCGFEYYGDKHLENILTAFILLYWFPNKFGVDIRTSHLSSMIISGQLSREEALETYEKPMYDEQMMNKYIEIIKYQLHISDGEFSEIMSSPPKQHTDYKIGAYVKHYEIIKFLKKLGFSI